MEQPSAVYLLGLDGCVAGHMSSMMSIEFPFLSL